MKKIVLAIVAVVAFALLVSCGKTDSRKSRPVCDKVVFSIKSSGYTKEILDLFRVNITVVDFNGETFSSNGSAEYSVALTKENANIASSADHWPVSVKVEIQKKAEPDAEKTYTFPHTFYIQAEFYDANGNKLDVSSYSKLHDEKIDRVVYSYDSGSLTYKGDKLEKQVRSLELSRTFVFFRHENQDIFCCTTK